MSRTGSGTCLELFVPGLLGAATEPDATLTVDCPGLRSLLDRASAAACEDDLIHQLCARFRLHEEDADLPLGAIVHAGAAGSPGDGDYALLAPIHLRVDRNRAYVVPLARDDVSADEAAQLKTLLEEQLGPLGYRFECRRPTLWSVSLPGLTLRTVSLERATAKDAYDSFPRGADARTWTALSNELQMLLHAHPLNERREQRAQLTINSVWLWGVGRLRGALRSPFTAIYGDGCVIRGLAAASGTVCADPPDTLAVITGESESSACVVLDHRFDDRQADAWQRGVESLERAWFTPLVAALRRGEVQRLDLSLDNGSVYRLTPRQARRWRFRRTPDLRRYLANS